LVIVLFFSVFCAQSCQFVRRRQTIQ
jgi:hypothetical protein